MLSTELQDLREGFARYSDTGLIADAFAVRQIVACIDQMITAAVGLETAVPVNVLTFLRPSSRTVPITVSDGAA